MARHGESRAPSGEARRRGFTLVELLVIIAIMAAMTTASMLSIRAGQGAARIKGASRDIFATIRQARSIALVTQQPAIISYSEYELDGEKCARIEITSTRMVSGGGAVEAETLSGEKIWVGGEPGEERTDEEGASAGTTVEDVLFAPMADEVVKGVRIKVTKGDELLQYEDSPGEQHSPKISVFSNVDYLMGRFSEAQKKKAEEAEEKKSEESASGSAAPAASAELQEQVNIVWEVNGRCEPHRVWIYSDGENPDAGLCIKVDRFGAAKILAAGEER